MKEQEILEQFGQLLIQKVRDETITQMEMIISGKMKSKQALLIHDLIKDFTSLEAEKLIKIIVESIDRSLHQMLFVVENNEQFDIFFCEENRRISMSELSDGLSGELYGEKGWISKFSKFSKFSK